MIKIFLLIFSFLSVVTSASEVETLYTNGEYLSVINHFNDVPKDRLSSVELNMLGNSFYRLDKKNEASLYYFLGMKLSPRSPEFAHNLKLVNSGVKPPEGIFNSGITAQEIFFLGAFILCLLSIYYFFRPSFRRKLSGIIIYFLLLSISFSSAVLSPSLEVYGVTIESIELKSGYDPNAMSFYELSEGVIIKKHDQIGSFVKVEVIGDSKVIGWTKRESLFF